MTGSAVRILDCKITLHAAECARNLKILKSRHVHSLRDLNKHPRSLNVVDGRVYGQCMRSGQMLPTGQWPLSTFPQVNLLFGSQSGPQVLKTRSGKNVAPVIKQ